MQPKFQLTQNGQAVYQEDINLISENAALADDRVLAELISLSPFPNTGMTKAIVPFRMSGKALEMIVYPAPGGVMVVRGLAVVKTTTIKNELGDDLLSDVRSAVFGTDPAAGNLAEFVPIQLPTIPSRWDLLYVEVNIDVPSHLALRKVKDAGSSTVTTRELTTRFCTKATLRMLTGVGGGLPSLPPDEQDVRYNIPLAYIRIPAGSHEWHKIIKQHIWEIAPIASITSGLGVSALRAADGNWRPDGAVNVNTPWNRGASEGPPAYIPSTMVGEESLIIPVDINPNAPSHVSGDIVDASRDWRYRIFDAMVAGVQGNQPFAWEAASTHPFPSLSSNTVRVMSATFPNTVFPARADVVFVDQTNFSGVIGPEPTTIGLYVNMSNGSLVITKIGSSATTCKLIFWIRASAQFNNASNT